jgi:hypothetical protein
MHSGDRLVVPDKLNDDESPFSKKIGTLFLLVRNK